MHPAFSVIFLTTLIGAAQGLFLALVTAQVYALFNLVEPQSTGFYGAGGVLSLFLLGLGLVAAVFHLGKPEYFITRAWRGMSQWRTSWLSRELIALPVFMGLVFLYTVAQYADMTGTLFTIGGKLAVDSTLLLGVIGAVVSFVLYIATAMIYASVRFFQEWHSPLTVANYLLLGLASGFTLAAAFAAWQGVDLVGMFAGWAVVFTILGAITRVASLIRNSRIEHKSTLQTAIGVRHTKIKQRSMGFMGGSFNTREFFHGATQDTVNFVRAFFLVATFVVPVLLLWGAVEGSATLPVLAFVFQYVGLLAERWSFFAEGKHPQNLYYQSVA
jgi:DMSO reductase anchor subunit